MDNVSEVASPRLGVFEYAEGVSIDMDAIPVAVEKKMLVLQLKHKFGNECDAAFSKAKKKDPSLDKAEWVKSAQLRMAERILDGTVGIRSGGPTGSTVEKIAYKLAFKETAKKLGPKGLWPKGNKEKGIKTRDARVDFQGQLMTRDELTQRVLGKYRERFMEEAREEIELAKASAVKAVTSSEQSLDELL